MASIPLNQASASMPTETIEQRFRRLEAKWKADTGHLSSVTAVTSHPAFREIVGMGDAVVPLMLHDLAETPQLWIWALPEITGADPVPPGDRGKVSKMSEAWVRWGREHGYRW